MKKLMLSAILLSALGLVSCRKEYTCECKTSNGGSTSIVNSNTLPKKSLKDARAQCDEGDKEIGSITTDCEIKL